MSKPATLPAAADYGDCTPAQTAQVLLGWCRAKTRHDTTRLLVLGVLAGVFIALGAVLFTTVMTGMPAALGPVRLVGGLAFAMGLLLVCMTGAELSTGNCMMAAAWSRGDIGFGAMWRVLILSFLANTVGAVLIAILMSGTGLFDGRHGRQLIGMAEAKLLLGPVEALSRAILCNALVCLAVWLILSARTLPSKMLGLSLPIAAFVACGFEHSIANLYFIAAAYFSGLEAHWWLAFRNIALVTAGNLVGGVAIALALRCAHLANVEVAPAATAASPIPFPARAAA